MCENQSSVMLYVIHMWSSKDITQFLGNLNYLTLCFSRYYESFIAIKFFHIEMLIMFGTKLIKSWHRLIQKATKWPNTLKQFVGNLPTNCLSVFDFLVRLKLKELILCQFQLAPFGSGHTKYWTLELFYTVHRSVKSNFCLNIFAWL